LPLPEDQVALIAQLTDEMAADLESIKGALARKGVENPEAKLMEIMAEKRLVRSQTDPYAGADIIQREAEGGDVDNAEQEGEGEDEY